MYTAGCVWHCIKRSGCMLMKNLVIARFKKVLLTLKYDVIIMDGL